MIMNGLVTIANQRVRETWRHECILPDDIVEASIMGDESVIDGRCRAEGAYNK